MIDTGVLGKSVTLNCKLQSMDIMWIFVPINHTRSTTIIVEDCVPLPMDEGRKYSVDTSNGGCSLVMNGLTLGDTGSYICQDTSKGVFGRVKFFVGMSAYEINSLIPNCYFRTMR